LVINVPDPIIPSSERAQSSAGANKLITRRVATANVMDRELSM
jgi:hypothetical protein